MKCRRSGSSPGAKLRGRKAAGTPPTGKKRNGTTDLPAAPSENPDNLASATTPHGWAGTANPPLAAAAGSDLHIDGHAEGSIHYSGTVRVGAHGVVRGEIHANCIEVEGEIFGNLCAEQSIRLAPSARVTGDLRAPRISVARGATPKGKIVTTRNDESTQAPDDVFSADLESARDG